MGTGGVQKAENTWLCLWVLVSCLPSWNLSWTTKPGTEKRLSGRSLAAITKSYWLPVGLPFPVLCQEVAWEKSHLVHPNLQLPLLPCGEEASPPSPPHPAFPRTCGGACNRGGEGLPQSRIPWFQCSDESFTCLITAEKDSPVLIIRLSRDLTSLALYPKRKEISHFPSYFSYINQLLRESLTALRRGTKATTHGLPTGQGDAVYKFRIQCL